MSLNERLQHVDTRTMVFLASDCDIHDETRNKLERPVYRNNTDWDETEW